MSSQTQAHGLASKMKIFKSQEIGYSEAAKSSPWPCKQMKILKSILMEDCYIEKMQKSLYLTVGFY